MHWARKFTAATAFVAATTGCGTAPPPTRSNPVTTADTRTTGHAGLDIVKQSGVRFLDGEGREVNLDSLRIAIGQNYSTISFMFANCGTICPIARNSLHMLSQGQKDVKHVVFSVDPRTDFAEHNLENRLRGQGLNVGGPTPNTYVLIPTTDGTVQGIPENSEHMASIQHTFEMIAPGSEPSGHSGDMDVYTPSGKHLMQVLGPNMNLNPDTEAKRMANIMSQAIAGDKQHTR